MTRIAAAALAVVVAGPGLGVVRAAEDAGPVLFDMNFAQRYKLNKKDPAGTISSVEGKFGKAIQFDFKKLKSHNFFFGYMKMPAAADQCEGFSFYLKGDGSDNFGCLEFIDTSNYGLRYDYAFPLKSTEWTKVIVPWRDVIPVLAGPLIGPKAGYKPSGFGALWYGKFYYWPARPAIRYAIDQVALERKIAPDDTDYTPKGDPLGRVRARLKAKKPVTIVVMGDSLTDKKHNSNARAKTWAEQLVEALTARHGSKVTLVNTSLGGTALAQNLVLMPTWLDKTPSPDLVCVFFGGNDYDNLVGQKVPAGEMGKMYRSYVGMGVDRIRRMTRGAADVLLMTTAPGFKRWETYKPLVQAIRETAKDRKAALADVDAAFKQAGTAVKAVKAKYWHWDNVHMGPKGHEVIRQTVLKAVEGTR